MEHVVDAASLGTEDYPYASYRRIFNTDRMAMCLVSVRPGDTVPEHVHHDEEQVYYFLRGHGTVTLGEQQHPVGPGRAVYIPLGTPHGVSNNSPVEPLDYLYVVAFVRPGQEAAAG
jgi:mannose-6-phosphate isomerase-like protein (cupin superfamily)